VQVLPALSKLLDVGQREQLLPLFSVLLGLG